jgi:hypothetical protein
VNFTESDADARTRLAREKLMESRARDRECIRRMQLRQRKWLGPVGDFFWRKPWKSRAFINPLHPRSLKDWLQAAHDCSDPSIACSCSGGFRFPLIVDEDD